MTRSSQTIESLPNPERFSVPRCTLHDLRHLAVTTAISEGVSLWTVSQTARHSSISTTANIYAHLTRRTAHQAVDAIAAALDREERHATTSRPPHHTPRTPQQHKLGTNDRVTTTRRPHMKKAAPAKRQKRPPTCKKLVGTTGFEPATPCPPVKCMILPRSSEAPLMSIRRHPR
ncbi:tyrosine-type recombinase/integrase [Streptomyces sp. NPDC102467]|uniref:tyrosine-type recombinase/integrase n=1 Tax=Streptomyces sp. NPDC102467 TaxID=3366179 RepID=UPI00381B8486